MTTEAITTEPTATELVRLEGIVKEFPGVRALDGVSFAVRAGEVHALVGENGAGKSTLIKVLGGVWPVGSYEGEIRMAGQRQQFASVRDAERAGIAVIYQELALAPHLSVAENIMLGREPSRLGLVDRQAMTRRAMALLAELGVDLAPEEPVGRLGVGQQQMVEIAKALAREFRVLVLDEPTASLSDREVEALMDLIGRLRARGVGMIYISHRLNEVTRIADSITVLRDGATVGTWAAGELDEAGMIQAMVGRSLAQVFPPRSTAAALGEVALAVDGLTVAHPRLAGRRLLDGVSISVRRGEVLGVAGLVGAGRTELLETLFGLPPGPVTAGTVTVAGQPAQLDSPEQAIAAGLALVSEDRKGTGLNLGASIRANASLAALGRYATAGWIRPLAEWRAVDAVARELRVKAPGWETRVGTLSGGNQQKVVLAKWLLTEPRALLLDEPTRGIDVGAKAEIYEWIRELTATGLAVILVSSELPEVLGLADRIVVLSDGRVTGEFAAAAATPQTIMAAMTAAFAASNTQRH